jgi:hypothetical protein
VEIVANNSTVKACWIFGFKIDRLQGKQIGCDSRGGGVRDRLRNCNFRVVLQGKAVMLSLMISIRFPGRFVFAAAVAFAALTCFGEVRSNPYVGIVDRNPFGLKPPPPAVVETNTEPAAPPPNVKLTGISNLFSKRALLEVTEQQAPVRPGQPPPAGGTVNRPILAEGEAAFGVEVVAIDLDRNIVKIRNGGTESELTFEVPKPSGSGAPTPMPPPVGRTASVPAPTMGQPTIVSSSESRGGVTMLGGGGNFAGNTGGVTSYGGPSAAGNPAMNNYSGSGFNSGLPTIPSRTLRTPNPAATAPPVDPAVRLARFEIARQYYKNPEPSPTGGPPIQYPPLPPTEFTPPEDVNLAPPPGPPGLPPAP